MRILFGVPVKVHKEIAEAEVQAFKALGNEVEVSYYGNTDQVKSLLGRFILILKNAINLKRQLRKQKSNIVYLNTAFDYRTLVRDSISIFILKLFDSEIKIVLKTHGTTLNVIFSNSILKKYLLRKTDLLLVLSQEEVHNFKETSFNRVCVTSNPVDFTEYRVDNSFRMQEKIDDQTFVLLFVGRFIKEKGILELIEACKIIKQNKIRFKLFCLGNGPLLGEIKQLIKDLGLENEILLVGHIPEKETKYYYSNCDILILPSYREGFPMAVFQAVAAGKPVITTKVNDCSDHLREYENCLWVEKNNPNDLAEKIIFLLKDQQLRFTMHQNNKAISQKFTAEKIVQNLDLLFKEFLAVSHDI
jgi:glycosyltransferase involved in cell wall biosynthesis